MDKMTLLFESYNMTAEGYYNRFLLGGKNSDLLNLKEDAIQDGLKAEIKKWEKSPLDALDGLTPEIYFEEIKDLDTLIELFKQGAMLCDEELPQLLLARLSQYGSNAVDKLLELVSNKKMREDEEAFLIPLMAVRVLGNWKVCTAVAPLMKVLFEGREEDEALFEEVTETLVKIGECSIAPLLECVENAEVTGKVQEGFLSVLSRVGYDFPSERIFLCLKSTFRKMDNKMYGAWCLGNYGDGRSIPAIRGYMQRNLETLDPETFYECKNAVERLGGSVEDLEDDYMAIHGMENTGV